MAPSIAKQMRDASLRFYRLTGDIIRHEIPNDEYWCSTKKHDYRLYRQALNTYLERTGFPWLGSFSECVAICRRERW